MTPNNLAALNSRHRAVRHFTAVRHFERSSPTFYLRFRSCESVGLRREKTLCFLSLWRLPLILLLHRVFQKWYPLIACRRQPKRKTRDRATCPSCQEGLGRRLLVNREQTGRVWRKPAAARSVAVRTVCKALKRTYGVPRLGNPSDPLDDLIYIILSNKTGPGIASRTYERLRRRFDKWEQLLTAPILEVRRILRPAGLSSVKSKQLRGALRFIKRHFGSCDLRPLRSMSVEETGELLVSLPGVSEKVAKCIMMYTLNHRVLPVDVHVHRVASRLGWTKRKRADQCHQELESLVPPRWRYAFHVGCVLHGRAVCRAQKPLCGNCSISHYCEYFKAQRA